MTVIIEVTRDELSLPIRVCDTMREMADVAGVTRNAVVQSCRTHRISGKNTRFQKVDIGEED